MRPISSDENFGFPIRSSPTRPVASEVRDFAGWCRDVGFRGVEILPLGPASAGIAYK